MAKADLFEQAKASGLVADSATPDEYTVKQLEQLVHGGAPAWEGSMSSSEPLVGPDGHVHLSADDIEARDRG